MILAYSFLPPALCFSYGLSSVKKLYHSP